MFEMSPGSANADVAEMISFSAAGGHFAWVVRVVAWVVRGLHKSLMQRADTQAHGCIR